MRGAAARAQSSSGILTLGFFVGLASGPLRDGLAAFIAASPDVRLRLVEGPPSELLDRLTARNLDMLITAFVPDLAGTIVTQEELWEEPLFVALPACHRLARQRPLSWPDLATLRLHVRAREGEVRHFGSCSGYAPLCGIMKSTTSRARSEEQTSELQPLI